MYLLKSSSNAFMLYCLTKGSFKVFYIMLYYNEYKTKKDELDVEQDDLNKIAKQCRTLRISYGLRQEDLAQQCQVSLQAIKNLEQTGRVEMGTFIKVIAVLGKKEALMEALQVQTKDLEQLLQVDAVQKTAAARVRKVFK